MPRKQKPPEPKPNPFLEPISLPVALLAGFFMLISGILVYIPIYAVINHYVPRSFDSHARLFGSMLVEFFLFRVALAIAERQKIGPQELLEMFLNTMRVE